MSNEPIDGYGLAINLYYFVIEIEFSMGIWGLGIVTVFRKDIWLIDVFFLFLRLGIRSVSTLEDDNVNI